MGYGKNNGQIWEILLLMFRDEIYLALKRMKDAHIGVCAVLKKGHLTILKIIALILCVLLRYKKYR